MSTACTCCELPFKVSAHVLLDYRSGLILTAVLYTVWHQILRREWVTILLFNMMAQHMVLTADAWLTSLMRCHRCPCCFALL